jgi:hypothetical protein
MPDPYWDDAAKQAAEDRARGKTGKDVWFPPPMAGQAGTCGACRGIVSQNLVCACRGAQNGPRSDHPLYRGRRLKRPKEDMS